MTNTNIDPREVDARVVTAADRAGLVLVILAIAMFTVSVVMSLTAML